MSLSLMIFEEVIQAEIKNSRIYDPDDSTVNARAKPERVAGLLRSRTLYHQSPNKE